jgi:hypothetical protein
MIVTAHQCNWLPGRSVYTKIQAADAVIWLDLVQFSKGSYTNRNRLPDGSWMTIAVKPHPLATRCLDVRVSGDRRWARRLVNKIRGCYPWLDEGDELFTLIRDPSPRLVELNHAAYLLVSDQLDWPTPPARSQWAASGDISRDLAAMVDEMHGTVYLSGPSGRRYLDVAPFSERGIEVRYWEHSGPNPSMLEAYAESKR